MDFKILFCLGFCKVNPSYGLICYGFAEEDLVMIENYLIFHPIKLGTLPASSWIQK